jgi:hypothetical protein
MTLALQQLSEADGNFKLSLILGLPTRSYNGKTNRGPAMRVDEYNSFESLLSRYRAALSRLAKYSVRIPDQSRLRAYELRLQQAIDDPRPAVELEIVLKAAFDLREIDEIIEIVGYLPASLDEATFSLLNKLVRGTEHPDDEIGTAAREAQYELYLGTVLRRANIPAKHGAPDLAASWQNEQFFIEAKRPSSTARFDDRLRSAVHQIRKLPRPGIIAMSLDQVLRPPNGLIAVESFDDLAPAVASLVEDFVFDNAQIWQRRLTGEPVAAVLLTARLPGRLTVTGHLSLGTNLRVEPILMPTADRGASQFIAEAVKAYLKAQS